MAIHPILRWPDQRLASVCDPVAADSDVSALTSDLFETMYDAPGRGLAAPQIGVLLRLFVMDVTWKDGPRSPMAFVNPQVLDASDTHCEGEEACLSIPGITTVLRRPDWVTLGWCRLDGVQCERRFDGAEARCAQHESDHLNGIVTFGRLPHEERVLAETEFSALS